jgi:hypothetical protein
LQENTVQENRNAKHVNLNVLIFIALMLFVFS